MKLFFLLTALITSVVVSTPISPNSQQLQQNVAALNGTWYMVGLDKDLVQKGMEMAQRYNISCLCPQVYMNTTRSGDTMNVQASCMLRWRNQTSQADQRTNVTASGLMQFKPGTDRNKLIAEFWMSRPYINAQSWFWNMINRSRDSNASSMPVPGMTDVKTVVDIFLVSNQTNQTNLVVDTFYVQTSDDDQCDNPDDIEILFGRRPSLGEAAFNGTMAKIPTLGRDNEVNLVRLNDTCSQ